MSNPVSEDPQASDQPASVNPTQPPEGSVVEEPATAPEPDYANAPAPQAPYWHPGYPPPGYPPQGYAPPGYQPGQYPPGQYPPGQYPPAYPGYPPYTAQPQTSSDAIIALILAVASWLVCPIVPAIVALVFAARADREIRASGGAIAGLGLSTAAKIVAWINIGILAATILVTAAFFAIAIVLGAMDAGMQTTLSSLG